MTNCIAQHSWEKFPTFTEHFEIGGFISSWVIATFNSGAMCISSPRKTCRRSPENLWVNLFSLWSCFTCKQHDIIFVSFEQNQHWYWPALISSSSFNKMLIIIKKVIHSFQGHFWIHISFVFFFTKITFKISDFLASVSYGTWIKYLPVIHVKINTSKYFLSKCLLFSCSKQDKKYTDICWYLVVHKDFFFYFCC